MRPAEARRFNNRARPRFCRHGRIRAFHGSDRRYSAHTTENAGAAETTLFYAATLNNMAGTYRQMQDYDRAIDLYLKARKLYHNICGRTSAPYIGSLNNLSLAYR